MSSCSTSGNSRPSTGKELSVYPGGRLNKVGHIDIMRSCHTLEGSDETRFCSVSSTALISDVSLWGVGESMLGGKFGRYGGYFSIA